VNEETIYPDLPSEIAQAVLDGIARCPDTFDMHTWLHRDGNLAELIAGPGYPPSANPWRDGTVMCAASWVAHVTGWTIHYGPSGTCTKGDTYDFVSLVAERALGLTSWEAFWFVQNEEAQLRLLRIALD
jgi:hypothetical protein